jgi:hypothetical protein
MKKLLGINDGENIYLSDPTWDCGWYWGFGYLGNKNCHYHLSGLPKQYNTDMKTALDLHFGDTLRIAPSEKWLFAELVQTAYALKETAEVLGRGGSHLTTNTLCELIKNPAEVERINKVLLPAIFDEMHGIMSNYYTYITHVQKIKEMLLNGHTRPIIDFMFSTSINCDDIKPHLSKDDYYHLHSAYYKRVHEK